MIKDIKELNFPAYATLETASATIADMGDRTITSQVKIAGNVVPDFSYDWEVEFKGERYIHPVKTPQGTKDNASRKAKIDMTFRHWAIHEMKRQYFVEMASTTAGTAIADKYIASLGLNLGDFVTAFNLVLNHYFGGRIVIRLNPEWQYDTEAKLVSISYSYIWDVLQQMHEIYGVRWTLKTNADGVCEILMGYPAEEVSHIFEYGFEGGLLSVQRQVQSTEIRNRLLGRGGEKNLPYRYFKDKDPNNPLFEADPDWIPELANIAFTELRGKTFRDYVRGWKAKRYGGTPMAEPTEAYFIGYNAEKFDPIEYVDDKESIEKYGVLVGALKNNEEIYPSIQGAPGDVDMIVDAEQVTDDDVDAAVENDSVTTNINHVTTSKKAKASETVEIVSKPKRYFSIPEGKIGNLDCVVSVSGVNTSMYDYQKTAPILESYVIRIYNKKTDEEVMSSETAPVINIPSGEYYMEVSAVIQSNYSAESSVSLSVHSIYLYTSTPDTPDGWKSTFDIWVRNIWNSTRGAGETDQQYADRVWLPILGDRMGDEARVVFASGWLSFSSDWEFPIVGYAYDDSKEGSHWRLTLAKSEAELESSGKYIPYEGYNASAGDRFFFIGIDMSHQYVLWGEERVDDYKRGRLPETARINPSWVIKTDKVRLNQNREGAKLIDSLSVGAQIRLASKQFISGAYESLYVQSMTYNWTADTILYPDVEVVVSDKVSTVKNPVAQMQGSIETLQRQVGSLSNIQQIIRQVCDQLYLRKDGVEDLSKSPTRFLGKVTGEKFRQGQIGGRDWGIYRDGNGNAIFEADKLVARQGILVSDLVVNEATYVGGLQINSAAAMKVTAVEETGDGYVCYFDQQQGSVTNKFKVDDVALCQKFDPEDNEIKFYKRRVIAIADASVTLSKTDVNGGGVPSVDDEIIHYGNYTDGTRQFVIIRDVIGGGYERMLMGLDSVNSDGVEYYFAGKSADSKARWFVGDDEQYAKYEDGQFTIKGNLFVTGSDKPISYITEALGDGAGGLILGTAIIVGYNDDEGTFVPMAGMSGVFDESRDDGGAAAWYGGVLGDAKIVFNMDGSGYLADGNIRWDKKGAVTFSDKIKISTEGDETLGSILSMLAVFNDMFYFHDENTIGTKYNFFSEGQNAAGGIGEEEGESGGGTATIVVDTEMSDASDNAVANKVIKAYVDSADEEIEQRLLEIEGDELDAGDVVTALGYTPADANNIPTKVSQLTDAGSYAKKADIPTKVSQLTDAYVYVTEQEFLNAYDNFTKLIPTQVSKLVNDVPYLTAADIPETTVDVAMSDTSTNAVQNKAIKAYVDKEAQEVADASLRYTDEREAVIRKDVDDEFVYLEGYAEGVVNTLEADIKANPSTYVPLKTINNMSLYGTGNISIEGGSGDGETTGLTAINVNGESFPPENGIVTLPPYPQNVADLKDSSSYAKNADLDSKVDKVTGKGLSTNDYTTAEKNKLAGLENYNDSDIRNLISAKADPSDIPTKTSDLINDRNYITIGDVIIDDTMSATSTNAVANKVIKKYIDDADVEILKRVAALEMGDGGSDDGSGGGVAGVFKISVNGGQYVPDAEGTVILPNYPSLTGYAKITDIPTTVAGLKDASDYVKQTELATVEGTVSNQALVIASHTEELDALDKRLDTAELSLLTIQGDISSVNNKFTDDAAKKAIADGSGNNIVNTYATKTSLATTNSNVATNKSLITALQNKFTEDGKAKDAAKLGGQEPSYYASQGIVDGLSSRVAETERDVEDIGQNVDSIGSALNALDTTLQKINTWYNTVGQYFDYDEEKSAYYVDGNFYATGQNAAGGIGDADGGTGGGLDESQLEDYLTQNGYLKSIPSEYVTETELTRKGYVTDDELTAKGYLTASDLGNYVSTTTFNSFVAETETALENINGRISTIEGKLNNITAWDEWYNKIGVRLGYDEANDALYVKGDFHTTGQNAAGGVGEVTGESCGGVANVEIKVNALSAYDGSTITINAMQTLTGLSVDVAQKMLQGAYNKVIDNSGDYPEVWDYTARGTSTGIIIYLRIGDGYDMNTAYALTYTQSAANWSIIMGEI